MKKPGNWGDGEGRGQAGGGEPEKPEKTLALFQRSPEGALFRSSALTTFSWLGHIFFLLLVDPLKYLDISRDRALTYSIIPLFAGVVFLQDAQSATPAQCFLAVNGKVYIDRVCDYDEDGDGSFSLGANGKSRYFAYLNNQGGELTGYWNNGASHANDELGVLHKSGACWVNDKSNQK